MSIPLSCTAVAAVLPTVDLDAAVEWYAAWLGEPQVRPTPTVAEWIITPSAWLQLTVDPDAAGAGSAVLGVDDASGAVDRLRRLDVEVVGPHTIPGVVTIARFQDPDGNWITLAQEAP